MDVEEKRYWVLKEPGCAPRALEGTPTPEAVEAALGGPCETLSAPWAAICVVCRTDGAGLAPSGVYARAMAEEPVRGPVAVTGQWHPDGTMEGLDYVQAGTALAELSWAVAYADVLCDVLSDTGPGAPIMGPLRTPDSTLNDSLDTL